MRKLRYQQLWQEAEAERPYRQLKGIAPTLAERAGDLLIALGQKLGGGGEATAPAPAWQLK